MKKGLLRLLRPAFTVQFTGLFNVQLKQQNSFKICPHALQAYYLDAVGTDLMALYVSKAGEFPSKDGAGVTMFRSIGYAALGSG